MPNLRSFLKSRNAKGFFALLGYGAAVAATLWTSERPELATGTLALAIVLNIYLFWPQITMMGINHPKNAVIESPKWLYIFGVAAILLVILGLVNLYHSIGLQQSKATEADLRQPYLSNKYVKLADIADANGVIEGRVFRDCWLYGPAVVFLNMHNDVSYSYFDGSVETIFTKVTPTDMVGRGVIILRDCELTRCHFIRVSFMGGEAEFEKWKNSVVINTNP